MTPNDHERQLLGAMLLTTDAIRVAVDMQLGPDDFTDRDNGAIYGAITDLYAQGEPADPVTVGERLPWLRSELVRLQQETKSMRPEVAAEHARAVEEAMLLRRLIGVEADLKAGRYTSIGPRPWWCPRWFHFRRMVRQLRQNRRAADA